MDLPSVLFSVGVYVLQQVGVVLGVGGETMLICAYPLFKDKGSVWRHEYGARVARQIGLWAMIISGVAVTGLYWILNDPTLFAPAFIFKWLLIFALLAFAYFESRTADIPAWEASVIRGAGAAQWYALLLVHMVAPVVDWTNLLVLYVGWLFVFMVGWVSFVYLLGPKQAPQKFSEEKISAPPVAPPAPVVPPPKVIPPAPAPIPKPIVAAAPTPPPAPKPAPVAPKPQPVVVPLPVVVQKDLPPPPQPKPAPMPPKTAPVPPPAPKPAPIAPPKPPVAAPAPKPPVAAPAPAAPIYKEEPPSVPAIQVMPRTPGEVAGHNRGAVVQFD